MTGRRHFLQRTAQVGLGIAAAPLVGCTPARVLPAVPAGAALPDDYWDRVRDLYPLQRTRAYLNTGGLGPAPFPVIHAVEQSTIALQTVSEHGHRSLGQTRELVAPFFGASPTEIAFTRNATEGTSTVCSGLELARGDEVIFETHAHPGGAFMWLSRAKREGIVVKTFEPDPTSSAGNLERIEALITPRTKVIEVSHITAPTGILMPVKEIAELANDRGIWFHVDGAQSAGQIPVDLHDIGCQSYATSGHKWMGAPHGTGLLYVREDRLDDVWPTEIGAYSGEPVSGFEGFDYTDDATRYEPGTRNSSLVLGVGAAVTFLDSIGMERVAARATELGLYLHRQLKAIPDVEVLTPSDPAMHVGMTTLRSDRVGYMDLYRAYGEAKMRCRIVTEQGLDAVRVSTHIFNNEAECDRVVAATRQALGV
ncbi:MAG: aminotransferase class V-fold PLP-dependent enzyme [Rubricoccaceae bacterium]